MSELISTSLPVLDEAIDPPVTVEVLRRPNPGRERDFEEYLAGISRAAMAHPGHLGTNIFRPSEGSGQAYRIIFKFDRYSNLRCWELSEERDQWRALAETVSTTCRRKVITGLETWFSQPKRSETHPPKHKMTLLVWMGIYLLVNIAFVTLGPLVESQPLMLRTLVLTVAVVPVMTYWLLPLLTRLFRWWLY